jgi:hypothetical protein
METGSDKGEVDRADSNLSDRDPGRRHVQRPVADDERPPDDGSQDEIKQWGCKTADAQSDDDRLGKSCDLPSQLRAEQESCASEDQKTKTDGDAAEHDDLRNLNWAQSPPGIEAIADGAAAQGREADVVAEREAGEGGEGRLGVGQRPADVVQGEIVKAREGEIARECEAAGGQQPRDRNSSNGGDEFTQAVAAQGSEQQESHQ